METTPEQLPLPRIRTIPDDKATSLATAAQIESNGGLFVLSLSELRPVREHLAEERFKDGASAFVELGRFALSPVALANLKQQIAMAEEYHKKWFGPLPDPPAFVARCFAELTEDFKRSLLPEPSRPIGFRLEKHE